MTCCPCYAGADFAIAGANFAPESTRHSVSKFPATTVKVISVEPCGGTKVCITMEMVVDVHRLAEVGSEMLHAAIGQIKAATQKN